MIYAAYRLSVSPPTVAPPMPAVVARILEYRRSCAEQAQPLSPQPVSFEERSQIERWLGVIEHPRLLFGVELFCPDEEPLQ